MSWQDEARRRVEEYGLTVTSGHRSVERNRQIGGSPTSRHLEGTAALPGAIDVGGTAEGLTKLFNDLKERFKGRIRELYLNIPGQGYAAIKGNQTLSYNPEAGRPRHVHIAIGEDVNRKVTTRAGIDAARNLGAGDKLEAAMGRIGLSSEKLGADQGMCVRRACLPTIPHVLDPPPCICWSDVWFYGGGTLLAVLGLMMLFASGRENP